MYRYNNLPVFKQTLHVHSEILAIYAVFCIWSGPHTTGISSSEPVKQISRSYKLSPMIFCGYIFSHNLGDEWINFQGKHLS